MWTDIVLWQKHFYGFAQVLEMTKWHSLDSLGDKCKHFVSVSVWTTTTVTLIHTRLNIQNQTLQTLTQHYSVFSLHQRNLRNCFTDSTALQQSCCSQTHYYLTKPTCERRRQTKGQKRGILKIKCCDWQATFRGETCRNLNARLAGHNRATRNGDINMQ